MPQPPIPLRLDVKKDSSLTIQWNDGQCDTLSLELLRSQCPCARCRQERQQQQQAKSLLQILPGNYAGGMKIQAVELVGNYALKIAWSDNHDSGIYSFSYLRELAPARSAGCSG